MSEMEAALLSLGEVADTNPETLPATTPPGFRFRYIDLSAVEAGFINWGAVSETTYSGAPSRARRVVQPMDVLYGTVRPNLRSHGFIGVGQVGPLVASTGFSVVRAKSGVSHPAYLFHSLMSCSVTAQAVRNAVGSSYPALNDSDVKRFQLFVPPYQEQEVAAQILDTLDTAIRETEALIGKLKAVKQGLLHDLLTRGIDANGQLRPPQSEAPQLYKESPLGWIPREWECAALAKRLARITYGFTSPMPTTDDGPWMLTATDVSESRVLYEQARHTTERAFRLLSAKSRPNVGDVLVTKDGTLGRVAVLDRDDVCVNQSVAVLSPKTGADSSYLATYLQSPVGQERMLADSGGSTIKHLYISKLAEMSIPWPDEHEMEAIVSRVSGMTVRLENEESLLSKLHRQKSGLMDDLLTGRVRVTPLLEASS